jgi:hypothetical protein
LVSWLWHVEILPASRNSKIFENKLDKLELFLVNV